mmetsp:Transcript_11289/g.20034  ORF Transcript_11289/g.20034 Transcript_11289/m.20034 type:complete len:213 (+) Transcript_11289:172-810(+)
MGLNSSFPFVTPTTHVAHVPSEPQSPVPPLSNRSAILSLSFTPRVSMARRRFSPANSSMLTSGSSRYGGYWSLTVTLGCFRMRLMVNVISSSEDVAGGREVNASMVASYPKHSVDAPNRSSFTFIPSSSLVLVIVNATIESPATIPLLSAFPSASTSSMMVIPTPSSRPPAISVSNNPNPPSRFRVYFNVSTNSSLSLALRKIPSCCMDVSA